MGPRKTTAFTVKHDLGWCWLEDITLQKTEKYLIKWENLKGEVNKSEALTSLSFNLQGQEASVSDSSLHAQAAIDIGETSSQRWQSHRPNDLLLLCPSKEQSHPWCDPRIKRKRKTTGEMAEKSMFFPFFHVPSKC